MDCLFNYGNPPIVKEKTRASLQIKNLMKRSISILSIVILTGCNSDKLSVASFNDRGSVGFSIISHIPPLILKYPIRMIVLGNHIIVADYQRDTLFNDINGKGELSRFGVQGRGPGEFLDGYGLAFLSDSSFIIGDQGHRKITFYKILDENITKYREVDVPWVNNVFPYDEDIIVTNGQEPFDKNYGVLDLSLGKAYSYIDFPATVSNDKIPERLKRSMNYNHIVRKPGSNRFVSFRASQFLVDIMDLNANELVLMRRLKYDQYQWDEKGVNSEPPNTPYLNSLSGGRITGSSSRIFICYANGSQEERSWNLLTFNWEGEPENRYRLPFVPYCIFSTPDGMLYCLATIEMEYRIVILNLI